MYFANPDVPKTIVNDNGSRFIRGLLVILEESDQTYSRLSMPSFK